MTDTNIAWPLPLPDALGGLVGADDVRDAIKATIDQWAPYYTAIVSARLEAAGKIGGKNQPDNPIPDFGKWVNRPEDRSLGTGQAAAYLVNSPSTVGTPELQGTGQMIATWRMQVTVQVFGTDWQSAADRANWYEKIVRVCIMQHRDLGGFAMSTNWVGSQYLAKAHTSTRTEGQVTLGFNVKVNNVLNVSRGPNEVPVMPVAPPPDPTVDDVIITIENELGDEPFPT